MPRVHFHQSTYLHSAYTPHSQTHITCMNSIETEYRCRPSQLQGSGTDNHLHPQQVPEGIGGALTKVFPAEIILFWGLHTAGKVFHSYNSDSKKLFALFINSNYSVDPFQTY